VAAADATTDSTLDDVRDAAQNRRGRFVRRCALAALTLFVALGLAGFFGVRTATVSASSGGYELTVEYPRVARAGLDALWRVTVRREGGFDGPVTLTTSGDYFDIFEHQAFYPAPAEETADAGRVILTFSPPPGDTLVVAFDAYVQPASQRGRTATTAVFADGEDVVSVRYRTWLAP
jgi:hypothetical protein